MPRPIRKPPQRCTDSFPATLASCADRTQSTEECGSCITAALVPSYNPAGAPFYPEQKTQDLRDLSRLEPSSCPGHAHFLRLAAPPPSSEVPCAGNFSRVSSRPHPRFPVRGSPPPGSWLLCETLLSPRGHHPRFVPSTPLVLESRISSWSYQ